AALLSAQRAGLRRVCCKQSSQKRQFRLRCGSVVASAIGLLAVLSPLCAEADPIISVGSFPATPPSYLPAPPPGTFLVPVDIAGAAGLQNWQFDLLFDNTVVEEVDPGDTSSGIYGAEFTPGDANSVSFILSGFPFNSLGIVDTVA